MTQTEIDSLQIPKTRLSLGTLDSAIRFIWVTDTHCTAGTPSVILPLEAAVFDCNEWRPNALVATGDLGNNRSWHTRAAFARLAMCRRPVIACVGNHDEEEETGGAGNPNTSEIEDAKIFNMSAPFNWATILTSGDESVRALCLVLDNNIYDDDPGGVTISENHEPGDRFGACPGVTDWWKQFSADCLAWVARTLETNGGCDFTIVFVHSPPAGMTFTNWDALIDLLQIDGRPAIGFCGHVHENATHYDAQSTDEALTIPFYKMPATYNSGAFARVVLSLSAGAISVDLAELHNYTDPGGWVVEAPFTVAA